MAGHSKWKNIAHKKGKADANRAKIFTKLSREIIIAVREGGPDPASNSKLKDVIAKARANNVPNDNINRVISRAAGNQDTTHYEAIDYEGYGPAGVAVLVEALTDNRTRTVGEVRHYFDKYGGNMGASGCVAWSFDRKGILLVESEGLDEETLMLNAIESGAEDFLAAGEVYEITTAPDLLGTVREALEKSGVTFVSAQVEMVPQTTVTLTDQDDIKNMRRLLEMLEDNDDIQNVWHNGEF